MNRFLQPLLLLLARATDRELARVVQFLQAENRVLRDKLPKRIEVTAKERQRLLKYGKPLGKAIRDVITIVSPRTFARWLSGESTAPTAKPARGKPGRPRTADEIRALVLKLGRETGWGYTRILGELRKLGVGKVSRSTVVNILKAGGLDPGPKRGEGTWDEFLKRHTATLWACDFFTKKVWTLGGLVDVFVLFVVHLGSRRVHLCGVTAHHDRAWVAQQARNLAMFFGDQPVRPRYLLRDRDSKFVAAFDDILKDEGVEVTPVCVRAPNMNAVAERFVQSVKGECLDHFVVLGERHLRHILSEYLDYYHHQRPHQGLGNRPPSSGADAEPNATIPLGAVACEERLGGLLKHYYRKAG